jgi:DNA-binding transcriptional LysR family regulator
LSAGTSGEILVRALNEAHVRPARIYETNDGATSLELVAQGMGVGFTSELRLRQARTTFRLLKSTDRQFSSMVSVVWPRRPLAPAADSFRALVRDYPSPLGNSTADSNID